MNSIEFFVCLLMVIVFLLGFALGDLPASTLLSECVKEFRVNECELGAHAKIIDDVR